MIQSYLDVIQTLDDVWIMFKCFFIGCINKAYMIQSLFFNSYLISCECLFLVLKALYINLTMICMIRDDVKTCHSWPDGHSWQVLTSSLIMQIMVALIKGL